VLEQNDPEPEEGPPNREDFGHALGRLWCRAVFRSPWGGDTH
jgi:hypothetical protein